VTTFGGFVAVAEVEVATHVPPRRTFTSVLRGQLSRLAIYGFGELTGD